MANLNLSQFTEKTLVADADWVFVWDTAGAISKKVSRNSLLNSGTLTTSAPVTISQTWDALAVAFTAFKVNATSTNSASGSLLLDLQVGGATVFNVTKAGALNASGYLTTSAGGISFGANGLWQLGTGHLTLTSTAILGWSGGANVNVDQPGDTRLQRDGAANTLALRNGAAAQTFNVYGTSSSSNTVYERMFAKYNGTDLAFQIGTETAGATLRPLDFVTGGSRRMTIGTTGNVGIGTTAPGAPLHVQATALSGARETLLKATISDNATDGFYISNATTLDTIFVPTFSGSTFNSTAFTSLQFQGITNPANDTGTNPLIFFQSGTVPTAGDPTNQSVSSLTTRPTFAFRNGGTIQMQMSANGNLGIGTTAPSSKLEVVGAVTVSTYIKVTPVAVTSLPSAATAGVGARAFVNDALAPVFGSTVATGGAVAVPVYSDGSAWKVG